MYWCLAAVVQVEAAVQEVSWIPHESRPRTSQQSRSLYQNLSLVECNRGRVSNRRKINSISVVVNCLVNAKRAMANMRL